MYVPLSKNELYLYVGIDKYINYNTSLGHPAAPSNHNKGWLNSK